MILLDLSGCLLSMMLSEAESGIKVKREKKIQCSLSSFVYFANIMPWAYNMVNMIW